MQRQEVVPVWHMSDDPKAGRRCDNHFMRLAILAVPILLAAQPIPRTWNAASLSGFELPLAQPAFSPIHISEETYYRIPERVLYKTYPVYHPGREPAGYLDWLKQQEPEIAFNPSDYHTAAQWIAAG